MLANIPLLVLNQLRDEPHNVFCKLFASRRRAKLEAMVGVRQWWVSRLSKRLSSLIQGLLKLWFTEGVTLMEEITAEILIEQGKQFQEVISSLLATGELLEVLGGTAAVRQILEQRLVEEVRQEVRQEAMVQTISRILAVRFGVELDHFVPALEPLPLPVLEALCDVAMTVDHLAEFEARLKQETDSDQGDE